jgi:hypothetical protein
MSVVVESGRRPSTWRTLPKQVRRRLRRTRRTDADTAEPFAMWAATRWRRTQSLHDFMPSIFAAMSGISLATLGHRSVLSDLPLVMWEAATFGLPLAVGLVMAHAAKMVAVVTTDAATTIQAARPDSALPLTLRHRSPMAPALLEFAVAGCLIGGWLAHVLPTDSSWSGLRIAGTVVVGGLAVLSMAFGAVAIRRAKRFHGVVADFDRDGVRLKPDGPRLAWSRYSSATIQSDWGGVGLVLSGTDIITRIDVSTIRERPLDALLVARRYMIAAGDRS